MEKPDILSRNSTRPKTGLFLTGKTRHFEPKLNTPENRTIPEWKNPFFFSQYNNNWGLLLAGIFSKKLLAGNFQKPFGGKISKEHLAGIFLRDH